MSWRRYEPRHTGTIEALEWWPDPKLRDSGRVDAWGVTHGKIEFTLETCDGRRRIHPGGYLVRVPGQRRPRLIGAHEFTRVWREATAAPDAAPETNPKATP